MGSFACCAFAGRYVYVFGGLEHDDNGLHIVSLGLFQERYDEMVGQWEIVKPGYEVKGQQLMQVSTAAAVQITKNQILVFGGYDDKNVGQKQSYVLRIE